MASIEQIAADIKNTYERIATGGEWLKMTEVAGNMGLDVSVDEFAQAVRHLVINDPKTEVQPEINQKVLTQMDRLYRVTWMGEKNDLIAWI
jgi:hypothetical protein